MKKRASTILLIAATVYLTTGLLFIAGNSFNLTKKVSRTKIECTSFQLATDRAWGCVSTADIVWAHKLTWFQWRFSSDGAGYDNVRYIPVDIVAIMVIAIPLYVFGIRPKK